MAGIKINILTNFNGAGFAKLQRELKRLDTPIEKLGAVTRSLAPAAQIGLVALTALGASAIRAAEDAQVADRRLASIAESMNLFGTQTGAVTKRLTEFADATMKQTAIDDEVIKATQAKLLTFKNLAATADVMGGAMDRATLAAIDLAAAGFGSAETNATQLGKALQDPIKGITALARAGVTFTEQEKEKIKTLVESGKLLEAQDMILKSIETQVGGTAAATASSSAKIATSFDELSESLGTALLPIVEELEPKLTELFDVIGKNSGVVITLAAVVGGLSAAILVLNFVLSANPIGLVVIGVALLAAGIVFLRGELVKLATGSSSVFDGLKGGVQVVAQFFKTAFESIGSFITALINGLITRFENFINTIISGLNGIINLANSALAVVSAVTGGAVSIKVPNVPKLAIPRVPVAAPKAPTKIPKLALGGIVMPRPGGVLANIAEAGQPEAVIPLSKMGQFTNNKPQNVYNINVNGGVGSGSTIGRAIVEAIKSYERTSGAVFVGA